MAKYDVQNTMPFSKEYVQMVLDYRYPGIKVNDVVEWMEHSTVIVSNPRVLYFGWINTFDAGTDYVISLFGISQAVVSPGSVFNYFPNPFFFTSIEADNPVAFQFHGFKITIDTVPPPQSLPPTPRPTQLTELAYWGGINAITGDPTIVVGAESPTGFYGIYWPSGALLTFGNTGAELVALRAFGDHDFIISPCTGLGVKIGVPTNIVVPDDFFRIGYTYTANQTEVGFRKWIGAISLPYSSQLYNAPNGVVIDVNDGTPIVGATVDFATTPGSVIVRIPDASVGDAEVRIRVNFVSVNTYVGLYTTIPIPPASPVGGVSVDINLDLADLTSFESLSAVTNCTLTNVHTVAVTNTLAQATFHVNLYRLNPNFGDDYTVTGNNCTIASVVPTAAGGRWNVNVTIESYTSGTPSVNFQSTYIEADLSISYSGSGSGTYSWWRNGTQELSGDQPEALIQRFANDGDTLRIFAEPNLGSVVHVQVVTSTAVVLYNYTGTANGDFSWVASGGLDYDVTVSFS